MADLQQAQQDQSKSIKARFAQLKNYLIQIKYRLQSKQNKKQRKKQIGYQHNSKDLSQGVKQQLIKKRKLCQQLQRVKQKIQIKQNRRAKMETQNSLKQQVNKDNNKKVLIFFTKVTVKQSLQKLSQVLTSHDFEPFEIYKSNQAIIFLNSTTLNTIKIKYSSIINSSFSIYGNFVKFKANHQNSQNNIIIKFNTKDNAQEWCKFLSFSSEIIAGNPYQKWSTTKLAKLQLREQPNEKQVFEIKQEKKGESQSKQKIKDQKVSREQINLNLNKKPFSKHNKILQKKAEDQLVLAPVLKLSHKKGSLGPDENQSSIFFLSNSSFVQNKSKFSQQQIVQSIKFDVSNEQESRSKLIKKLKSISKQISQQKIQQSSDGKKDYTAKIEKKQSLYMTGKIVSKLEQKQKLLNQSSLSKLGIHWHQDSDQKQSQHQLQSDSNSIQQNLSSPKKVSFSTRKKESTRRDSSNQSPPYAIKRVQSATRDKSDSRDSSQIQFQNKYKRKTDFSLQLQRVQTLDRKKNTKNQIRDHYLNRLIQKQAIKQISKSSSKASSSKKQINSLLIPIPQHRPSIMTISNYGDRRTKQIVDHEHEQHQHQISIYSQTESHGQKQSTQEQIKIQQLKNGIVLQKCNKDSWGVKQKRLYLSNTMNQLCYSDPHSQGEQKKIYLRDIRSLEFGRYSKGIIKHKKRFQQNRCLLIRIDKHGKQKLIQFYLNQSEPAQGLQQFTKKLQNFILQFNEQNQNSEI